MKDYFTEMENRDTALEVQKALDLKKSELDRKLKALSGTASPAPAPVPFPSTTVIIEAKEDTKAVDLPATKLTPQIIKNRSIEMFGNLANGHWHKAEDELLSILEGVLLAVKEQPAPTDTVYAKLAGEALKVLKTYKHYSDL
jgi:hypothetical protein